MAYTLKDATIPNKIRWLIAVDPADGVVKHYAPTDSTSRAGYAVTQGANVTIATQAWNGNTRSYFMPGSGTADADFVKFTSNQPSYNLGNTGEAFSLVYCGENVLYNQPAVAFGVNSSHYLATYDIGSGGNAYPLLKRTSNFTAGQANPGSATKVLYGFHVTIGTSVVAFYGGDSSAPTKSSSLGSPSSSSTDFSISYVQRRDDSSNHHQFKTHFIMQTDSVLSDAEVDALRADWFTELFESSGGGMTAAIKSQMLLKACS